MDERRGPPRDAAKERFWRRVIDGFDPARSTAVCHDLLEFSARVLATLVHARPAWET